MKRSHHQRCRDILDAIDAVAEMIADMDFGAYQAEFRTRRAVERCLEIISEASRHIPDGEKSRFPDLPWEGIAAMGDILRHEYQMVADDIVWRTGTRSLPELRRAIARMVSS